MTRGRRGMVLAAVGCVLTGVCAQPAAAYNISNTPFATWPFPRITYYVGTSDSHGALGPASPRVAAVVNRGFHSWSSARVGWTFRRVFSPKPGDADIVVLANLAAREKTCLGRSVRGFAFTQHTIGIRGPCLRLGVLAQVTAHEVGHVLGLGDEMHACAVMNPGFVGVGMRSRPSRCPAGPRYELDPVRPDDRAGARALRRRGYHMPAFQCDPPGDDQPIFAQALTCKYSFDCSKVSDGDNLIDLNGDGVLDDEFDTPAVQREIDRCPRTLAVERVPASRTPIRGLVAARGSFHGTTGQGKSIRFRVRHGLIRGLRLGAHLTCSDNNQRPAGAPSVRLPDETIGPFPTIGTSRRGFRVAFQPSNESALYVLSGFYDGTTWWGTLRVIEGYHDGGDLVDPRTNQFVVLPDPDGEWVCDTGKVAFTARR